MLSGCTLWSLNLLPSPCGQFSGHCWDRKPQPTVLSRFFKSALEASAFAGSRAAILILEPLSLTRDKNLYTGLEADSAERSSSWGERALISGVIQLCLGKPRWTRRDARTW